MIPPYKWRIVACLPGHSPVELFRSQRPYDNHAWAHHTRDLSPEWMKWVEYTLADKECLTPRVHITRKPGPDRLYLTTEEKRIAGVRADL